MSCKECKKHPGAIVKSKKVCSACLCFMLVNNPQLEFEWIDDKAVVEFKAPSKLRLFWEGVKPWKKN